jgi:hypothetical protein
MRVLVACEYSCRVRDAFRALGHDAWSCDLLDAEGDRRYHHKGDVLPLLKEGWDLLIAHPPCTRLCNSGVRWLHERNLWDEMRQAAEPQPRCLGLTVPELPRLDDLVLPAPDDLRGVAMHHRVLDGDLLDGSVEEGLEELRGLPHLVPTNVVSGREQRVHLMPPGPNRWKERSRTYEGIAQAMASQWGGYA